MSWTEPTPPEGMGSQFRSIPRGWDVIGAEGDKIGDVESVEDNYFVVSKGLIFKSERYIPFSAVNRTDDGHVFLNITKDEIETRGWENPPSVGETDYPERTGRMVEGEELLEVREERLRAKKETVQAGEVEIGKDIVTEERSMDVPVTHDEVVVERRSVEGREPAHGDIGDTDEEIHMPIREERVRAEKEPVVYEEVDVRTEPVQETERISETVRREEARIEAEGDVELEGGERQRRRRRDDDDTTRH